LREHGKYIPKQSFLMRRHFFNSEETGYFKTQRRAAVTQNPMADPSMMVDMLKGNVTNVLPMLVIGGWINWMISGFVTSELTLICIRHCLRKNVHREDSFYDELDSDSVINKCGCYFSKPLNVMLLKFIYSGKVTE
jgi:hypothetical protein